MPFNRSRTRDDGTFVEATAHCVQYSLEVDTHVMLRIDLEFVPGKKRIDLCGCRDIVVVLISLLDLAFQSYPYVHVCVLTACIMIFLFVLFSRLSNQEKPASRALSSSNLA